MFLFFVIGLDGKIEFVNYCVYGNVLIVDWLFVVVEFWFGGEY